MDIIQSVLETRELGVENLVDGDLGKKDGGTERPQQIWYDDLKRTGTQMVLRSFEHGKWESSERAFIKKINED